MVLRVDWATFNFADMTVSKICDCLAGGDNLQFMISSKTARLEGKSVDDCQCVSPAGLWWYPHSGDPLHPYSLQVRGVGCTNFASVLPVLIPEDQDLYHISRLDFAMDYLVHKDEWFRIFRHADDLSFHTELKKIHPEGGGYARTIYIGSRKSPYFFRIYNKSLQDPDYQMVDNDGVPVSVPDDYFIIRYECELKHHRRTLRGESRVFDPTALFNLYYSDEYDKFTELISILRDFWQSYAPDLVPSDWLEDVVPLWATVQNGKFCSNTDDQEYTSFIQSYSVIDGLHTFDNTMRYVVQRFGQYVPFILLRDDLYEICKSRCNSKFGLIPPIEFIDGRSESGFYDLVDPDDDVPFDYTFFDQEGGLSDGY